MRQVHNKSATFSVTEDKHSYICRIISFCICILFCSVSDDVFISCLSMLRWL